MNQNKGGGGGGEGGAGETESCAQKRDGPTRTKPVQAQQSSTLTRMHMNIMTWCSMSWTQFQNLWETSVNLWTGLNQTQSDYSTEKEQIPQARVTPKSR